MSRAALPIAVGRDPCRFCAVRGDLGCIHQAPSGAAPPEQPEERPNGRRLPKPGNGYNFRAAAARRERTW